MYVSLRPGCCKLDTFVYCVGLVLTVLYLLAGLSGVVWFVLCHSDDTPPPLMEMTELYLTKMASMRDSLAIMGGGLVVSFLGLLTCLLLVVGVKTEHRLLLLPWQVYHATAILACLGGGFYQALHFTVLAEDENTFHACLALFPVVAGIFLAFLWVLVYQLALRLRYRRQLDKIVEEKRASLASLHLSLPRPQNSGQHSKSVRSLKRRKQQQNQETVSKRSASLEHILTSPPNSPYYYYSRSRSLPRNLERGETKENVGTPSLLKRPGSATTPRKSSDTSTQDTLVSSSGSKSVTIHPRVTKFQYEEFIPRAALTKKESLIEPNLLPVDSKTNSENLNKGAGKGREWVSGHAGGTGVTAGGTGGTVGSETEWERHLQSLRATNRKVSSDRSANFLALSDCETEVTECYAVPSPVYPEYPTLPMVKRGTQGVNMTKHQIINLYCKS